MNEDNKETTPVETTTAPAPEPVNKEENATTETTPTPASGETVEPIDYKAELDAATKRLQQAEHVIEETKRENKELKNANSTTEQPVEFLGTEEELQNRIRSEAEKIADSKLQAFKNDILGDVLTEELSKMSSNPDEQALIRFHYENTIRQSGASRAAIAQDLATASAIANKKLIQKENTELKAALVAKNTAGKGSIGTNQDTGNTVVLTDEDKRIIDRFFGGDTQRYLKTKK